MNDATSDVLAAVEQIIHTRYYTDNVQVPDTKSEINRDAKRHPSQLQKWRARTKRKLAEADEPSDNLELDDEFDDIDLAENVSSRHAFHR